MHVDVRFTKDGRQLNVCVNVFADFLSNSRIISKNKCVTFNQIKEIKTDLNNK